MTIHWKAAEQYFTVMLFVFQFYPIFISENVSGLDLALLGVKEVINLQVVLRISGS